MFFFFSSYNVAFKPIVVYVVLLSMNALQELETTSDFQDIRLIMFDFIGIIGRKTQKPTKLMANFFKRWSEEFQAVSFFF